MLNRESIPAELIARELEIERESVSLGIHRYRSEQPMPWRDTARTKAETDLPPGKKLLVDSIAPLAAAITGWITEAESGKAGRRHLAVALLRQVDPQEAAFLAARTAINCAALQTTAQKCWLEIGRSIEDHIDYEKLEKLEPKLYRYMQERAQKSTGGSYAKTVMDLAVKEVGAAIEWTMQEQLRVGERLFDLFHQACGLVEVVNQSQQSRNGKPQTILQVRPTERCQEWLKDQHNRCALLSPVRLPMVVPPVPWTNPFNGGYMDRRHMRLRMVKTRNKGYLEELLNVDMPQVYAALNAVQETPWKINTAVLAVMREAWDTGLVVKKFPARDDSPLPAKPLDIDANEAALKEWKAKAAKVHETNAREKSKRLVIEQKLWVAERFKDEAAIYFPHVLDFRGRIYPVPSFVNPQGDDSGKALLHFAEGKPLGEDGAFWLAVHLANQFGVDKVSFDDRVKWVQDNEEMILDSAINPIAGHRAWTKADSPFCALAACFEWAGYKMQGADFVSRIPIALDGSCSGLQHFSAMLRDPVGGKAVNLIPSEKPQDIYTEVARVAQLCVDGSTCGTYDAWKGGKVNRKIAKQPVMTLPYGASRYGMQDQIENALRDLDAEHGKYVPQDNFRAAQAMSHVIYDSIGQVVVAARHAMDWLQIVADVAAGGDLPIHWQTPVGFPVLQEYKKTKSKRVEAHVGGRRMEVTLSEETNGLCSRRQKQGVSPNFVHSMDSSHLMLTVNLCVANDIRHFAMIHDSYGTHAAHATELSALLREAFIQQYGGDVLGTFREEVAAQLPPELAEKIPPVPPKGTLELAQIRESDYFFA